MSAENPDVTPAGSFLSPNVSDMLCHLGVSCDPDPKCLSDEGFIDWRHIEYLLPEDTEKSESEFYRHNIKCLASSFKHVYNVFDSMTLLHFTETYSTCLEWTGNTKVYLRSGVKCPAKLKDLLVTHELRQVFGSVIILSKYLPDGEENKLKWSLGSTLMDFLHDIFVYPGGPRLRDRVSHGEVDLDQFPEELASTLLILGVNLLNKCLPKDVSCDNEPGIELLTNMLVIDYQPLFHPVNITKRQHAVEILQQTDNNLQQKMHLLQQKKLRSRSRLTLKTMTTSVPCLCHTVQAIMLHVLSQLYSIETFYQLSSQQKTVTVKCLKQTLKYLENQKSFTSLDRNRWIESMNSSEQFMETVSPKWLNSQRENSVTNPLY
ncbi:hypothetical protein Ahia01_001261200 [Argonauta hians]